MRVSPPWAECAETSAAITTSSPAVVPLSDSEVAGLARLPDFAGRPAFDLEVTIPRTIHQVGSDASRLLGFALIAFGVVSTSVVGNALYRQRQEVGERARAEEQARASEQRYRELIDHMADAVFGIDASGCITFANPRAARLTGMKVEELTTLPYTALLPADVLDATALRFRRALELGATESFEVRLARARGYPYRWRSAPRPWSRRGARHTGSSGSCGT